MRRRGGEPSESVKPAGLVLGIALCLGLLGEGHSEAQTKAARSRHPTPSRCTATSSTAPGFKHFEYVNPEAPKGGDVKLAAIGTFDSLNPFILKGVPAVGIGRASSRPSWSSSQDEPFSEYGLVAESIEVPADRSWVAFTLRPEARFHDGSAITVEDVIWTFETLEEPRASRSSGATTPRSSRPRSVGDRKVKFTFGPGENRELPLIVGQLPVLSKAYWSKRDFEKTTLEPPLGQRPLPRGGGGCRGAPSPTGGSRTTGGPSCPCASVRTTSTACATTTTATSRWRWRPSRAGEFDFRQENVAKNWATAYNVPAVTQGLLKKEGIKNEVPTGMQAFVYNTRRPVFQDARVRKALGLRLRLRLDEQEPLLRHLHADQELLLQLGAGLARAAQSATS